MALRWQCFCWSIIEFLFPWIAQPKKCKRLIWSKWLLGFAVCHCASLFSNFSFILFCNFVKDLMSFSYSMSNYFARSLIGDGLFFSSLLLIVCSFFHGLLLCGMYILNVRLFVISLCLWLRGKEILLHLNKFQTNIIVYIKRRQHLIIN